MHIQHASDEHRAHPAGWDRQDSTLKPSRNPSHQRIGFIVLNVPAIIHLPSNHYFNFKSFFKPA